MHLSLRRARKQIGIRFWTGVIALLQSGTDGWPQGGPKPPYRSKWSTRLPEKHKIHDLWTCLTENMMNRFRTSGLSKVIQTQDLREPATRR